MKIADLALPACHDLRKTCEVVGEGGNSVTFKTKSLTVHVNCYSCNKEVHSLRKF